MDLNYYFKWELLATVQQVWSFPRNFSGMQTADGRNCNYRAMGCRLLPLTASFYYSVRIFMGNGRRHTLNVLVRIFFFQWNLLQFRKKCEYSSSLVKFQFQPWVLISVSVLSAASFRHPMYSFLHLPMYSWCPMVYSASPIHLKYMGHSHVPLSSYRWADWFLNKVYKNYKKFWKKDLQK